MLGPLRFAQPNFWLFMWVGLQTDITAASD
jgi:hypothetical protein